MHACYNYIIVTRNAISFNEIAAWSKLSHLITEDISSRSQNMSKADEGVHLIKCRRIIDRIL